MITSNDRNRPERQREAEAAMDKFTSPNGVIVTQVAERWWTSNNRREIVTNVEGDFIVRSQHAGGGFIHTKTFDEALAALDMAELPKDGKPEMISVFIPMKAIKTQRHRTGLAEVMKTARVFTNPGANSGWVLLYTKIDFFSNVSAAIKYGIPFDGMPEFNKDIQL